MIMHRHIINLVTKKRACLEIHVAFIYNEKAAPDKGSCTGKG